MTRTRRGSPSSPNPTTLKLSNNWVAAVSRSGTEKFAVARSFN
ncbi:MAG: hypothetical protein ACE5GQ_10330 [Nitrospinales bacterium]